jgi:hypothetical protein
MGKQRSVVYGLGTTRSQHWDQGIGGRRREQECRQRPEVGQGRGRSKSACLPIGVLLLVVSLGLFSYLPDAAADDLDGCMKESLGAVGDTPIRGKAFLCIDSNGVRVELRARALTPRNAYTIWFIYTDDPSQCATPGNCLAVPDSALPGQCEGPLDLRGFDPLGVIGRLDSAVAPRNGKMTFAGRVGGMRLSSGSQVLLFLAGHGRANASDNRARARQLLTPEDPVLGAPGLGNCVDGLGVEEVVLALFTIP